MNKLAIIERNLSRYFLLAIFSLSIIFLGQTSAALAQVEKMPSTDQSPRPNIPNIRLNISKIDHDISRYVNLAADRMARQSSTAYKATAERAVDGEPTSIGKTIPLHTTGEKQPLWEVDLGKTYPIGRIDLWNRTDCWAERLNNFIIFISKEPFKSIALTETIKQTGVFSFTTLEPVEKATPYPYYTPITSPGTESLITGCYVRIQLQNSGI